MQIRRHADWPRRPLVARDHGCFGIFGPAATQIVWTVAEQRASSDYILPLFELFRC